MPKFKSLQFNADTPLEIEEQSEPQASGSLESAIIGDSLGLVDKNRLLQELSNKRGSLFADDKNIDLQKAKQVQMDYLKQKASNGLYPERGDTREEGLTQPWYSPDELIAGAIAPGLSKGISSAGKVLAPELKAAYNAGKNALTSGKGVLGNELGIVGKDIKSKDLESFMSNLRKLQERASSAATAESVPSFFNDDFKQEGINTIKKYTNIRVNPQTGEEEALLFRGTNKGTDQYGLIKGKLEHPEASTWTYHPSAATGYASQSAMEGRNIPGIEDPISAWIPLNKVRNTLDIYPDSKRGLGEVIIDPLKGSNIPYNIESGRIKTKLAEPNVYDNPYMHEDLYNKYNEIIGKMGPEYSHIKKDLPSWMSSKTFKSINRPDGSLMLNRPATAAEQEAAEAADWAKGAGTRDNNFKVLKSKPEPVATPSSEIVKATKPMYGKEVIGQTPSGKPIQYASNEYAKELKYTPEDHAFATKFHKERELFYQKEADKAYKAGDKELSSMYKGMSDQHNRAGYQHAFPED